MPQDDVLRKEKNLEHKSYDFRRKMSQFSLSSGEFIKQKSHWYI